MSQHISNIDFFPPYSEVVFIHTPIYICTALIKLFIKIDLAAWLGFLDERKFIINQIVIFIEIHFLQIETRKNLKA